MRKTQALSREEQAQLYFDFYSKILGDMVANRSSCVFEFDSPYQTKLVISGLIAAANKEVSIFCKSFSRDLWLDPTVFRSIARALDRDVAFDVLTGGEVPEYFARSLITRGSRIQHYKNKILDVNHFVAVDSSTYAIVNPSGQRGFARFNDPIMTFELKDALR